MTRAAALFAAIAAILALCSCAPKQPAKRAPAKHAPSAAAKPGKPARTRIPAEAAKPPGAPAPGATAVGIAPSAATPTAQKVLQALRGRYGSMRTVRIEGTQGGTLKMDGKLVATRKAEKFTILFKRPDKVSYVSPESSIFANGQTAYIYLPAAKSYRRQPGGKQFVTRFIQSRPGVGVIGLLHGTDYSKAVASSKLLPDRRYHKEPVYVLSLQLKPGVGCPPDVTAVQTLWVGKSDLLIRRNEIYARTKPKRVPDAKQQPPKIVESTLYADQDRCDVDVPIPDREFVFKPPAGAKLFEKPRPVDPTNKPAPDFSFVLADGTERKLSELRGKRVVLVYWGLPMEEEQLRALQTIYDAEKDEAAFVAVNVNSDRGKVGELLQERNLTFPVVHANEAIAKAAMTGYGLRGFPTAYLIDREGVVRHVIAGKLDPREIAAKLAALR